MVGVAGEFAAELELLLKKKNTKNCQKKKDTDNFPEIEKCKTGTLWDQEAWMLRATLERLPGKEVRNAEKRKD